LAGEAAHGKSLMVSHIYGAHSKVYESNIRLKHIFEMNNELCDASSVNLGEGGGAKVTAALCCNQSQ